MTLPLREGKQTIIDSSRWQFNQAFNPMVDYQAVADYGVRAAIIRAGVGEHYVDPKFVESVEGYRNVGIEVMAYHVFDPDDRVAVEHQIDHFGSIIAGHEIKAVRGDFELPWEGITNAPNLRDHIYEYLMRARDLVGTPPVVTAGREENQGVYTANWWWGGPLNDNVLPKDPPHGLDDPLIKACGHSLWGADYGANNGDVPSRMMILPAGWRPNDTGTGQFKGKWSIWQFTSRGKVPGIHANVDLNLMRDDVFEDLFGSEPPPPPDPIPGDKIKVEGTFIGTGEIVS